MTVEERLVELSEAMAGGYVGDCLKHARLLREQLVAEGRDAWIGRLRKREARGQDTFHGPLTPLRYRGRGAPTWTTHYVCCSGETAFDPLLGFPIDISEYALAVFGEPIAIERAE